KDESRGDGGAGRPQISDLKFQKGGEFQRGDELARWVQEVFTTSYLRVYRNEDLLGVELAGALKNVIAIAAGVPGGMGGGDNGEGGGGGVEEGGGRTGGGGGGGGGRAINTKPMKGPIGCQPDGSVDLAGEAAAVSVW